MAPGASDVLVGPDRVSVGTCGTTPTDNRSMVVICRSPVAVGADVAAVATSWLKEEGVLK